MVFELHISEYGHERSTPYRVLWQFENMSIPSVNRLVVTHGQKDNVASRITYIVDESVLSPYLIRKHRIVLFVFAQTRGIGRVKQPEHCRIGTKPSLRVEALVLF